MKVVLLLIYCTIASINLCCNSETIINVADGVYSTKAESASLHLPSTSIFKPIKALSVGISLTKPCSVFVNYQITIHSRGEFWSKLVIGRDHDGLTPAASIVPSHYGSQAYKTATGNYMEWFGPGHYIFEVLYNSSANISTSGSTNYQTTVLQVMWFENSQMIDSDGIRCFPRPTPLNAYGVLTPLKNLKATLLLNSSRVVLAAYQLTVYLPSKGWFAAKLNKNNQQLWSTNMVQGNENYLNLNSLWTEHLQDAEYEFGLTYRTTSTSYFEDCRNGYQSNKILYVMVLPSACRIMLNLHPTTTLSLFTTAWINTDLSYSFTLRQTEHIFVRYQYATRSYNTYIITRLLVDSVIQQASSITGNTYYASNSGMWQGMLVSGSHSITVQHKGGTTYIHHGNDDQYTRALDIVRCY